MYRKYSDEKKPLTFKMAFFIVITVHLLGAGIVSSNLFSKNESKRVTVISPLSDALHPKKEQQTKKVQTESRSVKSEQKFKQALPKQEVHPISPKPDKYVLAPGDNFYIVCKKLNVSFAKLAEHNNVKDVRKLKVGQVLMVPSES